MRELTSEKRKRLATPVETKRRKELRKQIAQKQARNTTQQPSGPTAKQLRNANSGINTHKDKPRGR